MHDAVLAPGPWFAYSRRRKAWLWLRYQPWFKSRMLIAFARYMWAWWRTGQHLPPHERARDHGWDGNVLWPPPHLMWEITVCQDADQLQRYWMAAR
jgi:hypothetical protein